MTGLEWALVSTLGIIYLVLLFTMAAVTARKGHMLMFFFGFLIPILWLIGAVMKPKPGSSYGGPI